MNCVGHAQQLTAWLSKLPFRDDLFYDIRVDHLPSFLSDGNSSLDLWDVIS